MKAKDWIKKLQALPEEAEVNMWLLDTPEDVVNIAKGILAMDAGEGEKMHCGFPTMKANRRPTSSCSQPCATAWRTNGKRASTCTISARKNPRKRTCS